MRGKRKTNWVFHFLFVSVLICLCLLFQSLLTWCMISVFYLAFVYFSYSVGVTAWTEKLMRLGVLTDGVYMKIHFYILNLLLKCHSAPSNNISPPILKNSLQGDWWVNMLAFLITYTHCFFMFSCIKSFYCAWWHQCHPSYMNKIRH